MYIDKWTDVKLEELERKLVGVYDEAYKDLKQKSINYIHGWDEVVMDDKTKKEKVVHHDGFFERYSKEYQAYQDGKYTKQQFEAWVLGQKERGSRWEGLCDEMAARMTEATKISASYINGTIPTIAAENANFEGFRIERMSGKEQKGGINFYLVDEHTVRLLSKDGNLPLPHLSPEATVDMAWNRKQLQNELLKGILEGEDAYQIAKRFQTVAIRDERAAIRNARTAITGAQNAGRQARYEEAKEMGIDLEKEWISTPDDRTRESHIELDGVRVPIDEEFPNGCMYPGDPAGAGEEIWNCRCTQRAILPKYNGKARTEHTKASYEAWRAEKEESGKTYWWNKEQPEIKPTNTAKAPNTVEQKKSAEAVKQTEPPKDPYESAVEELTQKGIGISVDEGIKLTENMKDGIEHLNKLTNEYENTVSAFAIAKAQFMQFEAGQALMIDHSTGIIVYTNGFSSKQGKGNLFVDDENAHIKVLYHEFLHSMSQKTGKKPTELTDKEKKYWKECSSVYNDYKKNVIGKGDYHNPEIISPYAQKNVDEFTAECFTQAKLKKEHSSYAQRILDIVDRYWKK